LGSSYRPNGSIQIQNIKTQRSNMHSNALFFEKKTLLFTKLKRYSNEDPDHHITNWCDPFHAFSHKCEVCYCTLVWMEYMMMYSGGNRFENNM
jgi:hypothetical protein